MEEDDPTGARTDALPASAEETIADTAHGLAPRRTAARLQAGEAVGRYVVLETLGHGAMGIVYAAHDPKLDRKLALKLIRAPALDDHRTRDAQIRLHREAQALAQLSHPNVVIVHDVGRHDGQLFIAMEFVEGHTFREWLHERGRSWTEVLGVLVDAGRGLAAAHAAGLVHRDFKPENVLVGRDGRVRVMDFGIAQIGDTSLGLETSAAGLDSLSGEAMSVSLTREGVLLGTPAYMSPEQYGREPIDTRSDQWSFCVTLYEGLYATRPFPGDDPGTLAMEICRDEPLARPADSDVPAWIHHALLRGLAKDPGARFPSMDALLEALGRDPSRGRRLRRLGGALGLIGLATAGALVLHARAIEAECDEAGAQIEQSWNPEVAQAVERSLQRTGLRHADEVWGLSQPRLEAHAQAWRALRTDVCRRARVTEEWTADQLARATECLDERRSRLQALLDVLSNADRDVVVRAVSAVAELPAPDSCGDPAALTLRIALPEDPEAKARLSDHRRQLERAQALHAAGGYEQARQLAEQVLHGARADAHEPLALEALRVLAALAQDRDDLATAEQQLEEVYFGAERLGLDELSARAATALVEVVGNQARYDDALQWARHAEGALARLGASDDLAWASLLSVRGSIHEHRTAYDEALADQQRALAIRRAILGNDHVLVADSIMRLSSIDFSRGRYDDAFRTLEDVLAIRERALGPNHPLVAEALSNLGLARLRSGHYDQSQAYLERSLAIRTEAFGEQHSAVAATLTNLADLAFAQRQLERAAELDLRAATIREQVLGPEHPQVAQSLNNRGAALHQLRRFEAAEQTFARAVEIMEHAAGPEHSNTLTVRWGLAKAIYAQGRHEEGRRILDDVRGILGASADRGPAASHDTDYVPFVWPAATEAERPALAALVMDARAILVERGSQYAQDVSGLDEWLAKHPEVAALASRPAPIEPDPSPPLQ